MKTIKIGKFLITCYKCDDIKILERVAIIEGYFDIALYYGAPKYSVFCHIEYDSCYFPHNYNKIFNDIKFQEMSFYKHFVKPFNIMFNSISRTSKPMLMAEFDDLVKDIEKINKLLVFI